MRGRDHRFFTDWCGYADTCTMDDAHRILASLRPVTSLEARALSAGISHRCWPDGSDGHRPSAAEWVRRWRPERAAAANQLPACGCAAGRCVVCN